MLALGLYLLIHIQQIKIATYSPYIACKPITTTGKISFCVLEYELVLY